MSVNRAALQVGLNKKIPLKEENFLNKIFLTLRLTCAWQNVTGKILEKKRIIINPFKERLLRRNASFLIFFTRRFFVALFVTNFLMCISFPNFVFKRIF